MAILLNRAIQSAGQSSGVWDFYLPPYGPLNVTVEERTVVHLEDNVFSPGIVELYNKRMGWIISVEGHYLTETKTAGHTFKSNLQQILRDSAGLGKTFTFCNISDTEEVIKGTYRDCVVDAGGDVVFSPIANDSRCERFQFRIVSLDPNSYTDAPDSTIPPEGDYAVEVSGSSSPPPGAAGSGVTVTVQGHKSYQSIFLGVAQATVAANTRSMQKAITLSATESIDIKALEIIGANPEPGASSGNTQVAISDTAWDSGSGTEITCDVAYDAEQSASRGTGTISISAGSKAYLYIKSTANHENIEVNIDVTD